MTNFIKAGIVALVALFAPIGPMLATCGFFIFIDLITGVWAAKKRGEQITSAGLQRTLIKLAVYESALLLAFLAEHFLVMDLVPVARIVSSYIGVVELKSLYENINEVAGGDLLKALIGKLSSSNDNNNE